MPHTPPKKAIPGAKEESLAWLEAVKLLGLPFVLVLWLVTFVDSFVHNCYFNWTGSFLSASKEVGGVGIPGNWVMPVMSVGQIAEILTMFVLGITLKRLGWRTTMIVGILGHAARFAVYAMFPQNQSLIIIVQVLRNLLRLFLRYRLYLRRRVFSQGRSFECSGAVQRDDSWGGSAGGQFDLSVVDSVGLHRCQNQDHRLPRSVPRTLCSFDTSSPRLGVVLPPTEKERRVDRMIMQRFSSEPLLCLLGSSGSR